MPETPNGVAAQSAPTSTTVAPPGAPTEYQVPDGKALLDAKELETLRRHSEQLRGATPYQQAANKAGLRDPGMFEKFGRLNKGLESRKMSLDTLIAAFEAQQEEAAPSAESGVDLAALKKQLSSEYMPKGEFEKMSARLKAELAHEQGLAGEKSLIEKHIAELLGDDLNDWNKRSVMAFLDSKRGGYPADHPLADTALSPYDEKRLSEVLADLKKERAALTGKQIQEQADAAAGKKPGTRVSTPAGSQAEPKTKADTEDEPNTGFRKPSRDAVQKALDERKARRGGGTVSSLSA